MIKIKRVLMSVSDKAGIESLAKTLKNFGCEIISTGGTKKALERAGIDVIDISAVTGNPEAFGGRMKTISFEIESALLFNREKDKEEAIQLGIQSIDMVVCNLYPFKKVRDEGADFDTLIENIDIGGPTMIRAAAKNFKYVAVVTNAADYAAIEEELKQNDGAISEDTRHRLMRKAFNHTADYDSMIAETMDREAGDYSVRLAYSMPKTLRYGENSHQQAMFLRKNDAESSLYDMEVLHGKEISFNNIGDINAAIEAVKDLKSVGCSIIKHANPCGLAGGTNQRDVFERAWAGDPVSAFGSVIAFNRPVERKTAEFLDFDHEDKMKRKFVEVVVAPDFSDDAKEYLFQHKNLRVIKYDPAELNPDADIRVYFNSLLVQDPDRKLRDAFDLVTDVKPDVDEALVDFGMIAVRQLKSNAIAVVRKTENGVFQMLGMGCGQPNRVNSTELALKRSRENLEMEYSGDETELEKHIDEKMGDAYLISDAFFPFPDNIDLCAQYGIKTIFQPGGSMRDKAVIRRCNETGIAMVFTGIRHFKH